MKFDISDRDRFCASGNPKPTLSLDLSDIPVPSGQFSVSPVDGSLALADVQSSQVVVFSAKTGKVIRRLGQAGGYADGNVTVAHTKFFWVAREHIWVTHEDDGSLWVDDAGNQRSLHISADGGEYLGERQHLPASYLSTVSGGDSTRIFSNFLEFEVSYEEGKPLNQVCSTLVPARTLVNPIARRPYSSTRLVPLFLIQKGA